MSPLLMDSRCDVSEEDLLSLIGNTNQEAIERLEKRFPTLKKKKFLQGRSVSKFYEELKINTLQPIH